MTIQIDKSATFGVEIEQWGASRHLCNRAIQEVLVEHGYIVTDGNYRSRGQFFWHTGGVQYADPTTGERKDWKIMGDGSIDCDYTEANMRKVRGGLLPDRDEQCEVVSPPLRYDQIELAQAVLRRLNKYGARVNDSCGLHVHIDARGMSPKAIGRVAKLSYKFEPILCAGLGIADRRLRRYSAPLAKSVVDSIVHQANRWARQRTLSPSLMWQSIADGQGNSRYYTVNFKALVAHGTIEFRMFDGTMHAGKLKTAIQIVYAMRSWAMRVNSVRGKRHVLREGRGRYDMRALFCLKAGFIGDEFKTARKLLNRGMSGAYDGRREDRYLWGEEITHPEVLAATRR